MDTSQSGKSLISIFGDSIFSVLEEDQLKIIIADSEKISLKEGEILIEQGTPGDAMYLVVLGQLEARDAATNTTLNPLNVGDAVGEIALFTGQERSATVVAVEPSEVISITRNKYNQLVTQYPKLQAQLPEIVLPRIRRLALSKSLNRLLGNLTPEQFAEIESVIEWVYLNHGEVLFNDDDVSDAMYILVRGRLSVSSDHLQDGEYKQIGEVEFGETVGEVGLLSDAPRTATVAATRDSILAKLTSDAYLKLSEKNPKITTSIARLVVERQRAFMTPQKSKRVDTLTFTIVPLTERIDTQSFAEQFIQQTSVFGESLAVSASKFDDMYGYEGASQTPLNDDTGVAIRSWMAELEEKVTYLTYIADRDWTAWTQRCVSQSDRVLLLASGNDNPHLRRTEEMLKQQFPHIRQELILLHPENTEFPSGTAQWLDARTVRNHHHVRQGDSSHIRRAARRLTGHATGVVFSGGGARGYSHIGVVRALQENNVIIDMACGTSMGSLISGGLVLHGQYDELYKYAGMYGSRKVLFDFTFPIVSVMASNKVSSVMESFFGDYSIEDMWIPWFAITTNLTKQEPVVNKRGLLKDVVRASISLPAVFSPVIRDGDVYVDGSVMNNFPLDVMHDWIEGGTIIGTIAKSSGKSPRFEVGDGISGWSVLFNRLNPFKKKKLRVPTLPSTILKSQSAQSYYRLRDYKHLADLIIQPDVTGYSTLDFDDFVPIVETGYQTSKVEIEEWLKTAPSYITE